MASEGSSRSCIGVDSGAIVDAWVVSCSAQGAHVPHAAISLTKRAGVRWPVLPHHPPRLGGTRCVGPRSALRLLLCDGDECELYIGAAVAR